MGFKVDEVFVDFIVDFSQGEKGARRINTEMAKMGKTTGVAADAQDRLERKTRRAGKATKAAAKDTKKLGTESEKAGVQIKRMIKTLVGLEVARRVIRAVISTFVSFRTAMNNVRAITNATGTEFQRLNATALELGRTTQFTATDAAEAMAFLARTGLDVNQTIAVLPGTLNLAAATAVDLATAADLSTNILKGMGLEIAELDGLIDVLAATTNSANVNIFELGEAMKIVAPLAADAGMSIEETAALIGKLGDAGIKGSLAGTSLRRMLINLTTGAEGAQAVIDRLGLTIFDAEGNFVGLTNVIGQLERSTLETGDEFKLFGARGLAAAKVLKKAGEEEIAAFTEALEESGGTAERMAKQQMAGLVGAMKLLKSQAEATAIGIGDSLEPTLITGTGVLRGMLSVINGVVGAAEIAGGALFLLARTFLFVMETGIEGVGALVSRAISSIGFLVERTGALLSLLPGKFGDIGDRVQEFGDALLISGQAGQDAMGASFEATLDRLGFAWEGFKGQVEETADKLAGAVPVVDETTKTLDELTDAVDETSAAMQRARTALNLDVFTEQLAALRALLRETFGLEGEGALGLEQRLEIQRQLVGMTDKQVEAAMGLVQAEQDLAGAVAAVLDVQAKLNEAGEDQEKIIELTAALEQAVSALAAATRDADQAMEDMTESGKGIGEVLGQIALAVRGINRLADAFGLVDNDVRKAIDSVLDLVNAFKAVEAAKGALSLGAVLGIAGGAIGAISAIGGILGGLFGGDNAEQRRREALLKQNNERLDALRQEYARSLAILEDIPGLEFERGLELLGRAEERELGGGFAGGKKIFFPNLSDADLLFLTELAKAFGITLSLTAESFAEFEEALRGAGIAALTETFVGAMDLLQRRLALFDIDDPLDQLVAFFGVLEDFGDLDVAGLGAGLDTEAGRAALQQFIEEAFEQIAAGTFDLAQLGDLTLDQFLDFLARMEELLDDIEQDGVTTDDGLTENFVRSTRITEIQGNELLTLARTELVIERQQLSAQLDMVNLLGVMAGIAAPALDQAVGVNVPVAAIDVGGVIVNATFVITEEVDADALVERVGGDLAVVLDRKLSELRTREDRAVGDTGRVA